MIKCLQGEINMLGKKIKYYRLKAGFTSEELAKKIGCTKAAISLYESGDREPNSDICKKIADALNVSWIELLSRDDKQLTFNHVSFRKKQKASNKDIEILKCEIEQQCKDHITILRILGLLNEKKCFKARKLSFDDSPDKNAELIRKALEIPTNGPIYSIINVLEHAGIIVLSFNCADDIDGLNGTVNGIPYIFFNSKNRTIERQRFTLVHETCHLFFNDSKTCKNEREIEKYINRIAGTFLIPTQDIYDIFGRKNWNISIYLRDNFSQFYKVAPSCLLTRLHESGVITDTYYKNYFVFLNKSGGRKCVKTLL